MNRATLLASVGIAALMALSLSAQEPEPLEIPVLTPPSAEPSVPAPTVAVPPGTEVAPGAPPPPAALPPAAAAAPIGPVPGVHDANDESSWTTFGANNRATRFSPADHITPANVSRLVQAWQFRTGDLPPPPETNIAYAYEDTPLKVGDLLYTCTPSQIIIALDPATGVERWRHDPKVDRAALANIYHAACRVAAYHAQPPGTDGPCAERILWGTSDARLLAIDARTGQTCASFGRDGAVDLNENMGNDIPGYVSVNSAPIVVGDVVIVGHQVRDGQYEDAPSGVVRAYDVVTGGQAGPLTNMHEGRQYVVIAAGGHDFMRTEQGDYLIAYALPPAEVPPTQPVAP